MSRGPLPQSEASLKLAGSRAAEGRPRPIPGSGERIAPPPYLARSGKNAGPYRDHWLRLMPQLAKSGMLDGLDSDALARLCIHLWQYSRVLKRVVRHGESQIQTSTQGEKVRKRNPDADTLLSLSKEIRQLEDQLGLSPSSRIRLGAATWAGKRDEPTAAEGFLAGPKPPSAG